MKKLTLTLMAAVAATSLRGAFPELNVAEGTIESADGIFVGRDFKIPKDFKLELIYNVPAAQGQWVAHAWDDKGRLLVTGYEAGMDVMHRLTIPKVGEAGEVKVQTLAGTQVGASEGLLVAWGGLYMNVNRSNVLPHGVYKLTDTNNDDIYDKTEVVRNVVASGDHGTHHLRLAPDGNSIFVQNGNSTRPTVFQAYRVSRNWGEDVLTMRIRTGFMDDSYGDNTVEGYVSTFGKDGKTFELYAMGQRNPVGSDFNKDGEFFTYDSDMEWDMGDPWYRPTNVQHIVSGADFGFRNGSRKHPQWQFDLTPYISEVGAGSPVGFGNGVGLKFPARYQDALFLGDWSYGYLHSTFLTPKGSSYDGTTQVFIEGRPFPVTGVTVNKADGSMIILTGGRAQTQVYRVTYTGSESTAPSGPDTKFAADRRQRQALEKFHGKQDAAAVRTLWPYLGDSDRFMRYAARVALEWQDKKSWTDQALAETDPRRSMAAIVALARVSGKDVYSTVPGKTPAPDKTLQARMFASLDRIDPRQITFQEKLDLLRSYSLVMIRLGAPDEATRQRLIAKFDPMFPSMQRELNWELADMLAYLDAPGAPAKIMAQLRNAPAAAPYFPTREWANQQLRQRQDSGGLNNGTNLGRTQYSLMRQEDQVYYAQMLRVTHNGWTPELREEYLKWFQTAAAEYRGGNNFAGSNATIRIDAISQIPETAITPALKAIIDTPIVAAGGRGGAGGGGGGGARGGAAGGAGGGAANPPVNLPAGRGN
jgi:hypothetical protein